MIDSTIVPPSVHITVGLLVLITSVLALGVTGWAAWKRQDFSTRSQLSLILFQAALMVQILIGVKLLDQGLGPLQAYIHFLGGMAPIAFCLILYWLPVTNALRKSRIAAGVAALSFVFVLMTFAIGSMYVPGGA